MTELNIMIWELFFSEGMTPTQIDRQLLLPEGTAQQAIVDRWRRDKERPRNEDQSWQIEINRNN